MFYHVVMLKLTKDADAAYHAQAAAFGDDFRKSAKGLISYEYGRNVSDRNKGYDWAVVAVFETSADHDAYQVSELHQKVKAFMLPKVEDLVVCDFQA